MNRARIRELLREVEGDAELAEQARRDEEATTRALLDAIQGTRHRINGRRAGVWVDAHELGHQDRPSGAPSPDRELAARHHVGRTTSEP